MECIVRYLCFYDFSKVYMNPGLSDLFGGAQNDEEEEEEEEEG